MQKVRQQLVSNANGLEMMMANVKPGCCSVWEGVVYLSRHILRGGSGKTDVTACVGRVGSCSLTEAYTDTTLNSVRKKNRLLFPCHVSVASCLSLLQKMIELSLVL